MKISTDALDELSLEMGKVRNELTECMNELFAIHLTGNNGGYVRIDGDSTTNFLRQKKNQLIIARDRASGISKALRKASAIYNNVELKLLAALGDFPTLFKELIETLSDSASYHAKKIAQDVFYLWKDPAGAGNPHSDNPSFDGVGTYGGNQSNPYDIFTSNDPADAAERELIRRIMRERYPDMSDKEMRKYLKGAASGGCGYMAMTNTIFDQYKGREEEFEKTFGYPMYRENGELNYNAMFVDFHAAKGDPEKGTLRASRETMWESFMQDHDILCNVKNVKVTPENFAEVSERGTVVVGLYPTVMEDAAGNVVVKSTDAGHAMTVTGVTKDGRYIVSSWEGVYYIDPKYEYSRLQFQQTIYGEAPMCDP